MPSGVAAPWVRPVATNRTASSSVTLFERWTRASSCQSAASTPVSSRSSRRAPSSARLAGGDAALRDLPRVGVERVAVLADEQDPVVVVEDEHAGRQVREVDDAVDAGRAVRAGHLVVPERSATGSRRRPAGVADPGAADGGRIGGGSSSIAGIVARGGRARPRRGAGLDSPMANPTRRTAGPRASPARRRDRLGRPDPGTGRRRAVGEPVAARWSPPGDRVPAILEMIPYGKDNWRRNADIARGTYFAERGYALCRVDVRGTGLVRRRRARRVHRGRDARRRTTRWSGWRPSRGATARSGCGASATGRSRRSRSRSCRPPHLRAIVPVQGTDDRYLTDVHYIGGCVTVSEL